MATLDVLDYQVALDEALAQEGPEGRPLLEAPLRRQAVREARRVVDAMAFRFALLDERALPEDLDYLRALEAVKPPAQAAATLARRRPVYAARRRRRLGTTWMVLGLVLLLFAGGWYLITSEESVDLATLQAQSVDRGEAISFNETFEVTPDLTRLRLEGTVVVDRDSPGVVELRLLDPSGDVAFYQAYGARSGNFERENILDPEPGEWTLLVDFLDAEGSARVDVSGVRPAR